MRLHRIAQLVDALDRRVARGIEADRIIRAADVVVDRRRDADRRNAEAGQLQRAAERAVAADCDDAAEPEHPAGGDRLLAALFRHEVFAARGKQDRTAAGQRMAHVSGGKTNEVPRNQSLPAAPNADTLDAVGARRTNDRTNRGIHAGCVAAARQNTDAFDFLFHGFLSS